MGSARPPSADRLKLYGLYKQSTEGDVDGVMDRPRGESEEIKSDQEKWYDRTLMFNCICAKMIQWLTHAVKGRMELSERRLQD